MYRCLTFIPGARSYEEHLAGTSQVIKKPIKQLIASPFTG